MSSQQFIARAKPILVLNAPDNPGVASGDQWFALFKDWNIDVTTCCHQPKAMDVVLRPTITHFIVWTQNAPHSVRLGAPSRVTLC